MSKAIETLAGADITLFRDAMRSHVVALVGEFMDADPALAADSDAKLATQKAVKTAIAAAVTGLLDFRGAADCSANPDYPAANKGDAYVVSVAGKIGGAAGTSVDVGDVYIASADNAGGTQVAVGASWFSLEHNAVAAAAYTDAMARSAVGRGFTWQVVGTAPTADELLIAWTPKSGETVTFAGNFAGCTYKKSSTGSNPGSTYTFVVKKNGAAVGSIAISTGGVVTFTTTSGAEVVLIGGTDVLEIFGATTPDAGAVGYTFTMAGVPS